MNKYLQRGISVVVATALCILIAAIAHSGLFPKDPSQRFDPSQTCTEPPLSCWDGYNKEHFKCITYTKDTKIRNGVVFKAGTKNCYKSVYFNLDQTTLLLFFWMFVWAMITSRAIETMVFAALNNNIRLPMCLAIIASIPSIWYACAVLFHYLNDRYFPMYYSQLFYTITEILCSLICIVHLERDGPTHTRLLLLMNGTALAHIVQLLADEPLLVFGRSSAILRNVLFFVGDCSVLWAGLTLIQKSRQKMKIMGIIAITEMIVFHLFFADEASFTWNKEE
jgi:hypothetical protein